MATSLECHVPGFTGISVRGVAQPGSALGLGPRGRRFESSRPDHKYQQLTAANIGGRICWTQCDDIVALAAELVIHRQLLYRWRDQLDKAPQLPELIEL